MKTKLTDIQQKILNYIIEYRAQYGYPPTLAEIAVKFQYRNRATVREHLQAIEKKGYIKRNTKSARGIELTLEDKFFIPKPVLGEVAAGNPLTIYPDSIDTVELPTIIHMPKDSFLLKVKGDSLKDAYIFSGDVIIVNPNIEPKEGHYVVAILDDAAVVKRLVVKTNGLELHSENKEYKPIIVEKNHPRFRIVGVVVGVYRTMDAKTN